MNWKTFKAAQYEVAEYFSDHGMNLAEMCKAVRDDAFWRIECLHDFEEKLRSIGEMRFWIVQTVDNFWESGKTVALVPDRASAKSVMRHFEKLGHKCCVYPEPERWV